MIDNLIPLIDLTSLNDDDSTQDIITLCEHAQRGPVSAVCIYPHFVKHAHAALANTPIKIATVANFPDGKTARPTVLNSIEKSLEDGANEIDVVMPYHHLLQNNTQLIETFLQSCRQTTKGHTLKVIIESGALSATQIETATKLVADCGAEFVKTSTGKSNGGATAEAVKLICETLQRTGTQNTGIKISGGIRTIERATDLLGIIETHFGKAWLQPSHVRIGASQLLDQLLDL